jgi:WhiB family redox-sensing transcriptional regulator
MSGHLTSDLSGARPEELGTRLSARHDMAQIVWLPGEFDERAWRLSAACRDVDPDVFFPVGLTGPAIELIAEAKAICQRCPVRLMCLQYALANHQDDGVWGGYDEGERRELRHKWVRLGSPARFRPSVAPEEVGPLDSAGSFDWTPEAS